MSPAPDRIVRVISSARTRAQERTFALIEPLLTQERRRTLDELLGAQPSPGRSLLKWLGQGSSGESPQSITGEIQKLAFLREIGAHEWGLSGLIPNADLDRAYCDPDAVSGTWLAARDPKVCAEDGFLCSEPFTKTTG